MPATFDRLALLSAAVGGIGGTERPGQIDMVRAVDTAVDTGRHLLVQAGTGTGKSLAYLVPALAHAVETGNPVIVATATLALQAQIIDRDLPRLADAVRDQIGRRPTYALVKGRRHYLCLHKTAGGFPVDDEDALFAMSKETSQLGEEILRLRDWADDTDSGDRDEIVPGVSERAWRQMSVSARECLGTACPMRQECFVERSRAAAQDVDIVVTNHSFMAIDAFENRSLLPEHDLLVIDEAHELVDRVTATITDELSPSTVATAAKKAARLADTAALAATGDHLEGALEGVPEGRLTELPEPVLLALRQILDAARTVQSALKPEPGRRPPANGDGDRAMARAAVDDVFIVAERLLEGRELDVVWLTREVRRGPVLRVAPMSVAMLMRDTLFTDRTVVLTSATLELGGDFTAVAGTMGLVGADAPDWDGLDVGSPFDYQSQAIAYVARHLPAPGRDGTATAVFDEMEALIRAAGGRTLGLFSSMRAARDATETLRTRLGEEYPILCQGDDQMPTLVREFARDARTSLFGTLSLWQGVDVPGPSCQLVIIDRIPFPRPDDPLSSARSEQISRRGGNGFMSVAATHAALRLAQGAGRLVRHADDRGVVAFLDPRMMTARYAGFLQRSLPPFWPTTDTELVRSALQRLDASAGPVFPVREPTSRPASPEAIRDATSDVADQGTNAALDESIEVTALSVGHDRLTQ
ncbi:putative ATP-dependent helicase DinG [Austwickia sp. TVS 96-490-7B]|uniref:ATP-dependent DNA helicase n=1 Tax=Austwickia sp. TVS 96-490-7B TaxID=2830843 RepID=UPI001D427F26|nr:ATP-dependent DNA helicase [Austwickia sp. TVS 96-490-7B]MBW3084359.1 putative ATP-dependent helicase DinG [Austwickia sp. TVS 96-490-7B]